MIFRHMFYSLNILLSMLIMFILMMFFTVGQCKNGDTSGKTQGKYDCWKATLGSGHVKQKYKWASVQYLGS